MFFSSKPMVNLFRIDAYSRGQEQMKRKPLEARRRVFIIDDADRMND